MPREVPDFFYGELQSGARPTRNRGLLTERGLKHVIACVEAMKDVLGDEVGLALDCGPGWMVPDAIRLAQGGGAAERDVAGRPDHRRLHALRRWPTSTAR